MILERQAHEQKINPAEQVLDRCPAAQANHLMLKGSVEGDKPAARSASST